MTEELVLTKDPKILLEMVGTVMKTSGSSIYSQVSFDIAKKIAAGEIKEGDRFTGRSLMSTQYGVSPETIRRALKLLSDEEIVEVRQNIGAVVASRSLACDYVERFQSGEIAKSLKRDLNALIEKRNKINSEIELLINRILDLNSRFRKSDSLSNYEFDIPLTSPLTAKSVKETDFRNRTGGIIVAVRRNGELLLSPDSDFVFHAHDIIVVAGAPEIVESVLDYIGN